MSSAKVKTLLEQRISRKMVKLLFETIPLKIKGVIESLDDHLVGMNNSQGEQFVLGGSVLWSTQDPVAIANVVAINNARQFSTYWMGIKRL